MNWDIVFGFLCGFLWIAILFAVMQYTQNLFILIFTALAGYLLSRWLLNVAIKTHEKKNEKFDALKEIEIINKGD